MFIGRTLGSKNNGGKLCRDAIRKAIVQNKGVLEKIVQALINKALDGDLPSIREIFDRLDGKVPPAVTGEGGGPLQGVIYQVVAPSEAGSVKAWLEQVNKDHE